MKERQRKAEQQLATVLAPADRLAALENWTEEPADPPAAVAPPPAATQAPAAPEPEAAPVRPQRAARPPAAAPAPAQKVASVVLTSTPDSVVVHSSAPVAAPVVPEPPPPPPVPKKPWEVPPPEQTHPYHVILSEQLFQKIDFVWKRKGYKSAKEFVVKAIGEHADQLLKEMGELQ